MRLVVRFVAALVAAAALGTAALVISSRGALDERRNEVAAAWTATRPQLDDRYAALATANDAVREHGGSTRAVVGEIDSALRRWARVSQSDDIAAQISAANELEGLARRLRANVEASPLLANDASTLAFVAFDQRTPTPAGLNASIASYMEQRGAGVRAIVAGLFDADAIAEFAP